MSTKPIVPAWLPKTGPGRVATYPAAASTTITATATAIHFTFHRIIPGPPSRGGRGRRSASRRVRAARSECRPGGDPQLPSLRAHTVVDAEEPDRRLGRDPESVVDLEVRRQRPVRLRVARVREDDAGDPADPLEERERVQREAVLPRHDRHVVAAKPPRRVAAQRALSAEVELFLDGKRAASGPEVHVADDRGVAGRPVLDEVHLVLLKVEVAGDRGLGAELDLLAARRVDGVVTGVLERPEQHRVDGPGGEDEAARDRRAGQQRRPELRVDRL